jgi:hypothetical protein
LLATRHSPLATSSAEGGPVNLSDWRRRIDEIDKKLVELLNERSHCALEIGKLKQAANIPPSAASSNASLTKPAPPNATPCIRTAQKKRKARKNGINRMPARSYLLSCAMSFGFVGAGL